MLKLPTVALFAVFLAVFMPQDAYSSAKLSKNAQQTKNLKVLQADFYAWQVAVIKIHGHLVKVNKFEFGESGQALRSPIDTIVIAALGQITDPPAYLENAAHTDPPEVHIKKWLAEAEESIHRLRLLGHSFSTNGLMAAYNDLKKKMLAALEVK